MCSRWCKSCCSLWLWGGCFDHGSQTSRVWEPQISSHCLAIFLPLFLLWLLFFWQNWIYLTKLNIGIPHFAAPPPKIINCSVSKASIVSKWLPLRPFEQLPGTPDTSLWKEEIAPFFQVREAASKWGYSNLCIIFKCFMLRIMTWHGVQDLAEQSSTFLPLFVPHHTFSVLSLRWNISPHAPTHSLAA